LLWLTRMLQRYRRYSGMATSLVSCSTKECSAHHRQAAAPRLSHRLPTRLTPSRVPLINRKRNCQRCPMKKRNAKWRNCSFCSIGWRRRVQSTPNKIQCERQSRRGRWARAGRTSTLPFNTNLIFLINSYNFSPIHTFLVHIISCA